jgi:DnaJ-domain-containing protein 1
VANAPARPPPAPPVDDAVVKTEVALPRAPAARPPPPSGTTQPAAIPSGVDPLFAAEVERVMLQLGELDYFEILKITPAATSSELKKAYHQGSRAYHPDRFFKIEDASFREKVDRIYKRINEAYVVLRDDKKRAKYAADIAGPHRAQKLRFTEESEVEAKLAAKKEKEEEFGKTPQGRKFFEAGSKDLAAGRFVDAHRNFKMAATFEPGNALFKEKLLEAEKGLPKSDFKIK